MTGAATARLRLTGADCFVLALNRLMRKNGQQELTGQTQLILERAPDVEALQTAANRLAAAHPVLDARPIRNFFTLLPSWTWKNQARPLPIRIWRESGCSSPSEAPEVASLQTWSEAVMNEPLARNGGLRNLRLDLVHLKTGRTALVLTWSHLLFDGRGAELLVGSLLHGSNAASTDPPAPSRFPGKLRARIATARPVVERFFSLSRNQYRSLAGPVAKPGRLKFSLLQLDERQTTLAQARAAEFANPLFNTAFYLACAARAHRAAFQSRGEDPADYVMSVPVQIRRRGPGGSMFQNGVTMLFFHLRREDLETVESATRAAQVQFEEMTRAQLDRSFHQVLDMMKRLPSPLYMRFVGMQFQGEITSFFHSFTGEFCVPLDEVFGAAVANVYHIPAVSAPPGTGIFIGLFRGRLNTTFSWREAAASESEITLMRDRLIQDLTGEGAR